MNIFKENNCRLCKKVFCCKKCRLKHEEKAHNINPSCDICIYGQTILKTNITEDLITHIKANHWPLHCVTCSRMFGSINELVLNNKCPLVHKLTEQNAPKTPIRPDFITDSELDNSNYDSPPIMYPFSENLLAGAKPLYVSNIIALTTSTPMNFGEERMFMENISDAITPVDYLEEKGKLSVNENKSELTPVSIGEPIKEPSIKRRVTFSETPDVENLSKGKVSRVKFLKGSLKKTNTDKKEINTTQTTPQIKGNQAFLTVPAVKDEKMRPTRVIPVNKWNSKCYSHDVMEEKENDINEAINKKPVVLTPHSDSTIWASAVNATPSLEVHSMESNQQQSKSEITELTEPNTSHQNDVETYDSLSEASKTASILDKIENISPNSAAKPHGLWFSMANLVKTVMAGLSGTLRSENDSCEEIHHDDKPQSNKRLRTDSDTFDDMQVFKKIKLADIKCRKPINTRVCYHRSYKKSVRTCDKSTQTE